MIHNVYAIFDHAVKAFLPPFCLRNDGQALRTFKDCINSKGHQFAEHPEDYNLFHLATYDDSSGEFLKIGTAPKSISNGLLLVNRQPGDAGQSELPLNAASETIKQIRDAFSTSSEK